MNMWVAGFASDKMHLAANTTYKVMAETGGNTSSSYVLLQTRWPFVPSRAMRLTITSSMDRSPARSSLEYREFTGAAPLLPRGPTVFGSAGNAIRASSRFSIRPLNSASGRFRLMSLFRIGSTGENTAGMPCGSMNATILIPRR